jgi:peptidoglycan/LPS O-acetylase OafA/YrhL
MRASPDWITSGRLHGYRPDIDGLRGISVVAVIAFHAFPDWVPGGFIGVDVFFVISGFLISGIIFDEMRSGAFRLRSFYARRIRRIFPALVLVLTATVLLGWWILLPQDMLHLGKQMLSSAAFAANFCFWFQSGYFSPDAHGFPLLHLWSLGVEEQFYIVWPLVILLLRRKPDRVFAAILIIAALSFLLNILSIDRHEADFYSPLTRAWELMLGAAAAWIMRRYPQPLSDREIEAIRIVGLAAILSAALVLNSRMRYPGWLALVPTAGSVLLVLSPDRGGATSYLMARGPIVSIGRISYPLYLWHWPLLVLAEAFKFSTLTELERLLVVAVSFALAALTYEWVEKPHAHHCCCRRRDRQRKRIRDTISRCHTRGCRDAGPARMAASRMFPRSAAGDDLRGKLHGGEAAAHLRLGGFDHGGTDARLAQAPAGLPFRSGPVHRDQLSAAALGRRSRLSRLSRRQ